MIEINGTPIATASPGVNGSILIMMDESDFARAFEGAQWVPRGPGMASCKAALTADEHQPVYQVIVADQRALTDGNWSEIEIEIETANGPANGKRFLRLCLEA